jgi:hypothetical protein
VPGGRSTRAARPIDACPAPDRTRARRLIDARTAPDRTRARRLIDACPARDRRAGHARDRAAIARHPISEGVDDLYDLAFSGPDRPVLMKSVIGARAHGC